MVPQHRGTGEAPLLVALFSFVLSFLVTRVITRLIRAGRGPFKNVTPGGLHVHHVVPGVILVIIGGSVRSAAASTASARCSRPSSSDWGRDWSSTSSR